ncbi:hypothetical protein [Streptomyces genisteinicus]|uniref:Uncharacterized protein n=1 Tax=Streptomyces genisteinicus TaxID=2768068 RepID=A0A7H0HN88_9ACTN|nr:hypothetical protein [Streptomyces genisteinicus]QNP62004.1 hypothetical protein IAG43_03070 [Streptomyces genisteinicus]
MSDPSEQPDEPEQQQAAAADPAQPPVGPLDAQVSDYAFTTTEVGDEIAELPGE